MIKNCPVTTKCANLAEQIFCRDVSVLKGKSTCSHSPIVGKEDIVEIPEELQIWEMEVAAHIVFVKDQAFVNAVDRCVKFKFLALMETCKKLSDEELIAGLDGVIHHFEKKNIKVAWLHLDGEFKSIKKEGEKIWKLEINLSALDERVPDTERNNRTLQDRVHIVYHRLPFKVLPRAMLEHACMTRSSSQNVFPKRNSISKYFAPEIIVNRRMLDYQKHLQYSFGDYNQASYVVKPNSNNNIAQKIDAIYLWPCLTLQEGHNIMDLSMGKVVSRPKWTPCRMTKIVIKQVEDLAASQGIKSLKFYNCKRGHMVPLPNDLLKGVGGQDEIQNLLEEDPNMPVNNLPQAEDDPASRLLGGSDKELDIDEDIDKDELANLLDDTKENLW